MWDYHDFFDLDEDAYNFQYERELYELRGESQYIIAFIPKYNVDESLKDLTFLKKFDWNSNYKINNNKQTLHIL